MTMDAPPIARTGREQIACAFALDPDSMDNTPSLIEGPLVPVDADFYSLDELESLVVTMVSHGCVYQGARLICRKPARGPDDPTMEALEDLDFAGCLERRLLEQDVHIMIPFLDRCHPPTRKLLDEFVEVIRPVFESVNEGVLAPSAGLFVNAPHSIVRLHNDPEHGFLHHLRGEKQIHIFPFHEPRFRPADAPPDMMPIRSAEATRRYMADFRDQEHVYDLKPGQVVHLPNLAPHWVENGADIGMSLTFNFFSLTGIRRQKINQLNKLLQRKGWKAAPYRRGSWINPLKWRAFDVLERIGRIKLTSWL